MQITDSASPVSPASPRLSKQASGGLSHPTRDGSGHPTRGGSGHPTRDDRRVDLEQQVTLRYSAPEEPVTERTQNLSPTGMFIRTHSLRPPGTAFDFELSLAEGMKSIAGQSEVVWVRPQDDGLFRPAGMGVRFLDLDPADRQVIRWSVQKRTRELRKLLHLEALPTASRTDLKNLRMDLEDGVDAAAACSTLESSALAELRAEVDVALKEALERPPRRTAAERQPRRRLGDAHPPQARPATACAAMADRPQTPAAAPCTTVASSPPQPAAACTTRAPVASSSHRVWRFASMVPMMLVSALCLLLSPVPRPLDATPQKAVTVPEEVVPEEIALEEIAPEEIALEVSHDASVGGLTPAPVRTPESDLEALTLAWAEAWSQQRARTYLAFYSADFNPPNAMGREAWKRSREEKILKPRHVRVEVRDLESEALSADYGRVSFTQIYSSDRYRDTVRKTFDLVRSEQGWKILAERVETQPAT